MFAWICKTCGNQQSPTQNPPPNCVICDDPRQYVGWSGQDWTTLQELAQEHRCVIREVEPGLWGVGVEPTFAIGQRGLIVTTPAGNVMWDVPGFVDEAAMDVVRDLGGLAAISASHPHFYGVMGEWAEEFGAAIFLPSVDREWIMRPGPLVEFYETTAEPVPGTRLVRCGGHFPGSAVLHWESGAGGAGALLTGDTIAVAQDRDWVSIMWSYPNLIPLDEETVRSVAKSVDALAFDRIYGGWWGRVIASGAKAKLASSIGRYVSMIGGDARQRD
jgi:glyoxylase-like metal-dependent hydrolase (beta-lactamase superfamily II)